MPSAQIEIAGTEYAVDYGYRITCRAQPETGPTYDCGGQPAEPMEYEVTVTGLSLDAPGTQPALEMPAWLKALLEARLQEDDRVYDQICDEERAW
jgi:hypothetical protein